MSLRDQRFRLVMPPSDRIQLVLLGTVEIRGQEPGVEPLARIQPKRTALLAYLAMAGGPARRDTLLALLWPELDDTQARRALNQAVFHLRRSLGDDLVESGGMESVALNSERITCDAAEFEQLVKAGRLAEAMELYRGPFAPGFHVSEVPEFERWIDGTRARLDASAFNAASILAAQTTEHDPRTALRWARRAYEIDQGDAAVRRVIALHDALGDRAGAIREYEQFARRIKEELDVEPSPETQRLADEIRARDEPIASRTDPMRIPGSPTPAGAFSSMPGIAPAQPPAQNRSVRRAILLGVGAVSVAALAGMMWLSGSARGSRARAGGSSDDVVTTSSKEALAAYRAGQRELDDGRFESAVDFFRRAVASDSNFAMANYRLSVAANWTGQTGLANSAAAHAQRLAAGLPLGDRTRIEAWIDYLHGETDAAARLYTGMLSSNPKDFDAAFYLAEIQFHWGPSFGTSAAASAPAWDRVLALDPSNAGAIIHRLRIAAMQFDSATFQSLATRFSGLNPSPDHQIEVRALRAFAFGDSTSRAASTAEIASVDALRKSLVHETLVSARDLRGASRLLIPAIFLNQTFPSFEQGEFLLGAQTSAATGHMGEALATIDSAISLQPDRALEYRAMMVSLPGVVLANGERASTRRALDAPLAPQTKYASAMPNRYYLASILAVRDGDLPAARRKLEQLVSQTPRAGAVFDTSLARHIYRLSQIAGAEIARAQGKPDSALALLGKPAVEPDRRVPYVWSYPRAEERFLRGELLAETGKPKEALAWFATFPDPGAYDLAYLPAALQRRAEIADRIGDRTSANAARARLKELMAK